MEVQIFGLKKSPDTRKALRFFAERRIRTHFVDLDEKPLAVGELGRFEQKFGIDRLVDRDSKRYQELGLRHSVMTRQRLFDWLLDEPRLLRLPLVRRLGAAGLTLGVDEAEWKAWAAAGG
jgi:arsenate reductase (glutaredoxin)